MKCEQPWETEAATVLHKIYICLSSSGAAKSAKLTERQM